MNNRLHIDFEIAKPVHLAGSPLGSSFVDRTTSLKLLQTKVEEALRNACSHEEERALRVTLSCVRVDLQQRGDEPIVPPVILSQLRLDQDAWLALANIRDTREFLYDALYGPTGNLLPAARAQIDRMTNHYEHASCGTAWTDDHSCACDDECPSCGECLSPVDSEVHQELQEIAGTPGIFGLASALGESDDQVEVANRVDDTPRPAMRY